jgi:hypothetical protein
MCNPFFNQEGETTMRTETSDKLDHAKQQGQAQFESIRELVACLQDDDADNDRARDAIIEDALDVQVRSGWYGPGIKTGKPEEFQILLCTGGPAVRLIGTLNEHGEAETVTMQIQDWFQPWTDFAPETGHDGDGVLLAYARCFYFGD